jgi:hypothetical protein
MNRGQRIQVEGFDRSLADGRLYDVRGAVALVCTEQEWARAQSEKREPDCLGWPLTHVREAGVQISD